MQVPLLLNYPTLQSKFKLFQITVLASCIVLQNILWVASQTSLSILTDQAFIWASSANIIWIRVEAWIALTLASCSHFEQRSDTRQASNRVAASGTSALTFLASISFIRIISVAARSQASAIFQNVWCNTSYAMSLVIAVQAIRSAFFESKTNIYICKFHCCPGTCLVRSH